jgi:hypothetical protein
LTIEVGAVLVDGGEGGVAAVDPGGGGVRVVDGVDVLETMVGPALVVVMTGEGGFTGRPIGYCFTGPPIAVCFLGPPSAFCAKAGVKALADTPRNTTNMTAPLFMALPFRQLATGTAALYINL